VGPPGERKEEVEVLILAVLNSKAVATAGLETNRGCSRDYDASGSLGLTRIVSRAQIS